MTRKPCDAPSGGCLFPGRGDQNRGHFVYHDIKAGIYDTRSIYAMRLSDLSFGRGCARLRRLRQHQVEVKLRTGNSRGSARSDSCASQRLQPSYRLLQLDHQRRKRARQLQPLLGVDQRLLAPKARSELGADDLDSVVKPAVKEKQRRLFGGLNGSVALSNAPKPPGLAVGVNNPPAAQ